MKYKNAAEILPEKLLKEIQEYINGDILYVPRSDMKNAWGTVNGSRKFYLERNREIKERYGRGCRMEELAEYYGLTVSSIKRIVYHRNE